MTITAIVIPLQAEVTATGTQTSQPVSIPEELLAAICVWRHIVDDTEADAVAERLQRKVNELCQATHC